MRRFLSIIISQICHSNQVFIIAVVTLQFKLQLKPVLIISTLRRLIFILSRLVFKISTLLVIEEIILLYLENDLFWTYVHEDVWIKMTSGICIRYDMAFKLRRTLFIRVALMLIQVVIEVELTAFEKSSPTKPYNIETKRKSASVSSTNTLGICK